MNMQIQHVITDITGVTGLAIVDAILGGDRDPATLAKLRDRRIQASEETIRKSLEGNWRQEHLVTFRQSRDSFRHYQKQILGCDEEIEKLLLAFSPRVDPAERPLPANRKRTRKERTVNPRTGLDLRTESYKLFGVELTQVPGLMALVLALFSEVGRDMSRWATAGHFVSWLAPCPGNDINGGRVLSRGCARYRNGPAICSALAAHSLHHDESPLGDYLRRMKTNLGRRVLPPQRHTKSRSSSNYGEESGRVRRDLVGSTRHPTGETDGSKAAAAGRKARLPPCLEGEQPAA
jgi:transposase